METAIEIGIAILVGVGFAAFLVASFRGVLGADDMEAMKHADFAIQDAARRQGGQRRDNLGKP
ncbi:MULTISPECIES: hypothetical protein [Cupriavidus]|jgi:hypothetical protein|uniref:Uncharacterized protein n=1 Tax=Cupriavidus taiwanensis TaxID=164546 RepID=A0A7Z7NQA1_9BURK|nr:MULTISPECIES: hypothetical protein [Cupriavidus]NSX14012.1 hypothetical protein [Cupriavidus taiwanensis]SOZ96725.1 hypothetical protein CBM2598_U20025 [Cupriavidus taiwanensis]SPC26073.1 hypothetical protein CBM2594_U30095 [Cupriavidus taiwanensis]SPD37892.1 protein of unknown function [Cupriavidus taiwanensis]